MFSSPRETILAKQSQGHDFMDMLLKNIFVKILIVWKMGSMWCEEGNTSHPWDAQILNYIASPLALVNTALFSVLTPDAVKYPICLGELRFPAQWFMVTLCM